MEKHYQKLENSISKELGCRVNSFLTVKDVDDDHVRLIVTYVPCTHGDNRNHVASDETVSRELWEKSKKFAFYDLNGVATWREC